MASNPSTPPAGQPTQAQSTTHLHYGGSLNPKTGRFSPKPKLGTVFKKQKRYELMARLENAGIGEGAAAAMLCISIPRLRYLKKNPDYINARLKITHGIIVDFDSSLAAVKEQRKELLMQQVPQALQIIINELQTPAVTLADRKHKASIAQDLLDREGTFAKISKSEIKAESTFDFTAKDTYSSSILDAIRGVSQATPQSNAFDAIEANKEFANSSTISETDQQAAITKLEADAKAMGITLSRDVN